MPKAPLLLLLLTIATYASVWNGKADTKWYKDSESEFTITTPEQLAGLAKLVNKGNDFKGKTIKLGANIMLNDTANWQNWDKKKPKNNWKPIGYDKYKYYGNIWRVMIATNEYNWFVGTFDGNGFTVSGVYVNQSDSYAGLFGYAIANIKNLGVTASYIKGDSYTGGLVGYFMAGTISNCYFSGTVIGSLYVGGLAGYSEGKVIDSYSTGMVTGKEEVGGLVGDLFGDIIDGYSTGTVTGEKEVGGLVGNLFGNITNSYSTSMVTGDSVVGGFVGTFYRGEITNSYYDKETSRQDFGIGSIGKVNKVKIIGEDIIKGKSSTEMKRKETYNGWDFDKAWGIDSKVNGGYPYLRTE